MFGVELKQNCFEFELTPETPFDSKLAYLFKATTKTTASTNWLHPSGGSMGRT